MRTHMRMPAHKPSTVGEILQEEFLEPLGITQGELAEAMGVGRKTVNELCVGRRAITTDTAILLATVLGTTAMFWLNLQLMNNLWDSEHDESLAQKVKAARPLIAA